MSRTAYIHGNRHATIALGYSPRIRLYTLREAAVILRRSPLTLREYIKRGCLFATKIGQTYFIQHLELARVMGYRAKGGFKCGKRYGKPKGYRPPVPPVRRTRSQNRDAPAAGESEAGLLL